MDNTVKFTDTIGLKTIDSDDPEKQIIEMVCSKEAIDRDRELVITEGIDLKNIKKNGPLYFSHRQSELPIGRLLKVWKDKKELKARAQFVSKEANPLAPLVYQSIKEKSLQAVSIGFLPDWESIEYKTLKDGKRIGIIHKSELLEVSIVGVPANVGTSITVKGFKEANELLWEKGIFDGSQLNLMNEAIDRAQEEPGMDYKDEIKKLQSAIEELKDGRLVTQLFDEKREENKHNKMLQEMIDELRN